MNNYRILSFFVFYYSGADTIKGPLETTTLPSTLFCVAGDSLSAEKHTNVVKIFMLSIKQWWWENRALTSKLPVTGRFTETARSSDAQRGAAVEVQLKGGRKRASEPACKSISGGQGIHQQPAGIWVPLQVRPQRRTFWRGSACSVPAKGSLDWLESVQTCKDRRDLDTCKQNKLVWGLPTSNSENEGGITDPFIKMSHWGTVWGLGVVVVQQWSSIRTSNGSVLSTSSTWTYTGSRSTFRTGYSSSA